MGDYQPDLGRLGRLAENHDGLLSGRVARYALARGLDDTALASELGITAEQLTRLKLCREPRADQVSEDAEHIAAYVGIPMEKLLLVLAQP